jgi:predicted aspartyl protease
MSGAGWWVAAALLLAGSGAAAEPSQCKMAKVADLPVRFERNRVLVPVAVNGRAGWFLIDTGSFTTAMFPGGASAFGLRPFSGRGEYWGIGGGGTINLVVLDSFELSGVKVKGMRMAVVGHGGSPAFAGILGRDVLDHYDLEFDLADKAVRLWTPKDCGRQSLAYWTKDPGGAPLREDGQGGEYRVKLALNGKDVDATLDSGAVTTIVTPAVASEAGVRDQDFEQQALDMGGLGAQRVATRVARFATVAIGTETVQHARLQVADMFKADTREETGHLIPQRVNVDLPVMLLGADFLRSHRVLIAPDQHLLYFTYSGGPIFQVVGDAPEPAAPRPPAAPNPEAAPAAAERSNTP